MNTKSVTGIPLIIEASLNGSANKDLNPNVPYSDDEIVNDAMACMDAGAALIHNHTFESIFGGTGKLNSKNRLTWSLATTSIEIRDPTGLGGAARD
jgi:3-keto-5-aminohexanoate cleavage enzyme